MATFEFQVVDGVKCGGCNWETSKLYVAAANLEAADALLHNLYGCSGCGKLEWEHPSFLGFRGGGRENAEPYYTTGAEGACSDFSPNSDEAMEGAGMCGECFASYLADNKADPLTRLLNALDDVDQSMCSPCSHPETYGHRPECSLGQAEKKLRAIREDLRLNKSVGVGAPNGS